MSIKHAVYVGNFGEYAIPDMVQQIASVLNNGKSLDDGRTKGAKYLQRWGVTQDRGVEMAQLLETMIEQTSV